MSPPLLWAYAAARFRYQREPHTRRRLLSTTATLRSATSVPPPPAGDARLHLARGRTLVDECKLGSAFEAFDRALEIDPFLADARFMRAQLLENRDVAAAMAEYDALIAGDPEAVAPRLRRALLRRLRGDSIGALADYQAVDRLCNSARADPHVRRDLALDRAALFEEMGFLHGANAEYETLVRQGGSARNQLRNAEDRVNLVRNGSRLHWKAGRFENAAQGFSALVSGAVRNGGRLDPQHLLWRHLALARIDPQRAANTLAAAWPAPAHGAALRVSRSGASPAWEPMGPPCPTAKWPEPALELFCGRLEPAAYLAMAGPALEISDRWCAPASGARVGLSELRPPAQHLWRAEVDFYLGQWYLLSGATAAAHWRLAAAAADSRARTFECYAAGAELARLATD